MRKTQQKFLERAIKNRFSEGQIAVLSDETLTVLELRRAFDYFNSQRQYFTDDEIIVEYEECVRLCDSTSYTDLCKEYRVFINFLFPWRKDLLLGTGKKKLILDFLITKKIDIRWISFLTNCYEQKEEKLLAEYIRLSCEDKSPTRDNLLDLMKTVPEFYHNYVLAGDKAVIPSMVWGKYAIYSSPALREWLRQRLNQHPEATFDSLAEYTDISDADEDGYKTIKLSQEKFSLVEMQRNPYFEKLKEAGFLDEIDITEEYTEDSLYQCKWYQKRQFDNSTADRFVQVAPDAEFSLREPYYNVTTGMNAKKRSICMIFSEYLCIKVHDGSVSPQELTGRLKLLLFDNGKIYEELCFKNRKKLIPLTLKTIEKWRNGNNPFFAEAWKTVTAVKSKINPFIKDIDHDMKGKPKNLKLPPVSLDKMLEYHSKADFMTGYYKRAKDILIKWNRRNMAVSYFLLQCKKYLDDMSFQKLIQLTDQEIMEIADKMSVTDNSSIKGVIAGYIFQSVKGKRADTIMIFDYIDICMAVKEKISLRFRSIKKLEEAHNRISEKYFMKKTGKVAVPKDSKFLALRKKLPQEFEWIKSRKRLLHETAIQHHCVWSYADEITSDRSAIYSFVDISGEFSDGKKNTRYTLEFKADRKGRYFIQQIQGKYNQGDTSEIYHYVEKLLS